MLDVRQAEQLVFTAASEVPTLEQHLEVLTNETNYFSAELGLVQAQLNERLTLVQLYRSLGGGWEQ